MRSLVITLAVVAAPALFACPAMHAAEVTRTSVTIRNSNLMIDVQTASDVPLIKQ